MAAKKLTMDMTAGRPLPLLLRFAVPLILSALFQQLYSFVDTAIVGRCISVQALSAVGVTNSVSFFILRLVMGSAIGFNIPLAQRFGAGDREELSRYFWNGLYLIVLLGAAVTAVMLPLLRPLLVYLNTAEELLGLALEYLRVIVLGLVATALYNYLSGVLRALGDSEHPLYFLLLSSAVNLALDLVFVLVFGLGVAGAAWATVISQAVSAALCGWWLFAKTGVIRRGTLTAASLPHMAALLAAGLPMGLNYSVTAIGIMAIQSSVNRLGTVAVAAHTAGEKIRTIMTVPLESVGTAVNTYVAQNYGAGRQDRIRRGIAAGLVIETGLSVLAWLVLLVGSRPLVGILLGDLATAEAAGAVRYLSIISLLFPLLGVLMVFRNTLQGIDHSMLAMLSSFTEIAGRVACGRLAVALNSFTVICVSNPAAWVLADVYCLALTLWFLRPARSTTSPK